jgi:ribonucleoside-triphosphate reductase (formate)
MLKVQKRDGRVVEFNSEKIYDALSKAADEVGKNYEPLTREMTAKIVREISKHVSEDGLISVEDIQDLLEKVLVEDGHYRTAKAYIIYRKQHETLRDMKKLFSNVDKIEQYINLNDWRIKENANMAYSLQGMNFHVASIITKEYWLNKIYPKLIREAHVNGDFHIHDLGALSVYCVGWDLQDLLKVGFTGVPGKISCKPPKHLRTVLGQLVNFFYTLQGESAGAQAFSNFDSLLAPFIAYDNLTYKEVKQALQEFVFNMNVPTRVGFQTPFTNVTLDFSCPSFLKDEPVIIGGKLMDKTYGEFNEEIKMFNHAFAEVLSEGDAHGRVFSFPIPTINITEDFDWDDSAYDKVWEITAKYGIPYFANFIGSDMNPDDVRSMCCRLRLDNRVLQKRGGGLFGSNPLTGSIGVVTINLPRLGYKAESEEDFFIKLTGLMEQAKQSLEIKRKILESLTDRGLYPYSHFYLRNVKKKSGKFWTNHFSTIGLIGMNEACLNVVNSTIGDEAGLKFAEKVMDFMRDQIARFQEETGDLYNLEATPGEGTTYRLAKIDQEDIPNQIFANTEDVKNGAAPYYTNSTALPVNYTDDLFEALEKQEPLQTKYTGGTVFHTFIGERNPSPEAVKNLIKKMVNNFKVPYVTISPTFSVCPSHGYIYGEHHTCPKCAEIGEESNCEVYTRIVGYIRPVEQWNKGKQSEYYQRKLFDSAFEKVVENENRGPTEN